MILKREGLFFGLVFVILLSSFSLAQIGAEGIQEGLEGLEGTRDKVESTREVIETKRFEFLADQWKEILLDTGPASRLDAFFTNLNPLFIMLFARDYSFSLVMLLAFMVWLFTFLSLKGYFVFLENENYQWLAALAATILLAHLQIFNFVANGMIRLIILPTSIGWNIAMGILIIFALVFYLYINKYFVGKIKAAKKINKEKGVEHRIKKIEAYQEGLKKGSDS